MLITIALAFVVLLEAAVVCTAVENVESKTKDKHDVLVERSETQASYKEFNAACSATLYPDLCISTLLSHRQSLRTSTSVDVANVAMKVTIDEVEKISGFAYDMNRQPIDRNDRAALEDCMELFGYTLQQLNNSLASLMNLNVKTMKRQAGDIWTWLSASLTNQETCMDGFTNSNGNLKSLLYNRVQNVSMLVSNSLAIVKRISATEVNGKDLRRHKRRLLSSAGEFIAPGKFMVGHKEKFFLDHGSMNDGFPEWLSVGERRLLQNPPAPIQADVVVAQDGTGSYKTITEAVNAAPKKKHSEIYDICQRRNLCGRTASGKGFMARDMTFENTAGPTKGQAPALQVGSDRSAFYRCKIKGYQDTLYAHSQRQFYRECDIYGTIDFIFGNSAAVFQSCNILARKPLFGHQNVITAQGRTDPNQNTGFSLQNCKVSAASDLLPVKKSFPTYLGRPWKEYSRTVYMQSFLDDLIHPSGWQPWSPNFALKTLYYGEYMNSGPGAGTVRRVKWPGYRVITTVDEANKFTVAEFIYGNSWLPSTGVAFQGGLKGGP
eukprot:Gb_01422 [translate_table: standard]